MHDSPDRTACAQVARQMLDAARAHARKAGKPRKAPASGAVRRVTHTSGVAEAADGAGAGGVGGTGGRSPGASPPGDIALRAVLAADAVRSLTVPHGATPAGPARVPGDARPEGSALRRNTHRAARPQESRQLHGAPLTGATHQRERPEAAAAVKKVR